MRTFRFASTVAVLAVLTITCGDDRQPDGPSPLPQPSPNPGPTAATITRLTISGPNTVAPGESAQLTLTADYSDGTRQDQTTAAQWSPGNGAAVRMDGPGHFTGLANGESHVSATLAGRSAGRELVVVPTGTFRVTGFVGEPVGGTPVSFAQVRVRDGSGTGQSTETDFNGRFVIYGVKPDTDFVVSRTGYLETTKRVTIDRHAHVSIQMPLVGPRLEVNGTYQATFRWSNCSGNVPDDVRTRVYKTSVAQRGSNLEVRFTQPTFLTTSGNQGNLMVGHVDATGIALEADEDTYFSSYFGPFWSASLTELFADNSRLTVVGRTLLTDVGPRLEGPFTGTAKYHGSRYPVDPAFGTCSSGHLTLDRR